MPGLDRTGPNGAGPMTGGARGLCAATGQRRDFGRAAGNFRTGSGWRGGRRRMAWDAGSSDGRYAMQPYGGYYRTSPANDLEFLTNRSVLLEQELQQIQKRIDGLKRNEENK